MRERSAWRTLGAASVTLLLAMAGLAAPAGAEAAAQQTPHLPTWTLVPRTDTSVPLGVAELPEVTSPPPWTIPLTAAGYIEEEYFISSTANVYSDTGADVVTADVPYTTRLLLWRPADPKAFSGTVYMEPLRDQTEATTIVRGSWPHIVRNGDVAVQYSMATGNVDTLLKGFDPVRYASIDIDHTSLRWDIMGQVAWLVKSPDGLLAHLGYGAPAKQPGKRHGADVRLYSVGTSLTGSMQVRFMNDFHETSRTPDGRPLIDGYLVGGTNAPLRVPADVPVIRFNSEHEVSMGDPTNLASVRRPDGNAPNDRYRLYELAGAPHANFEDQGNYYVSFYQLGLTAPLRCLETVADLPGKAPFASAALHNLDRWARAGTPPPPGSDRYIATNPDGSIIKDSFGNTVGGVRPYWVDVPTSTVFVHSTNDPAAPINCPQHAHEVRFTDEVLRGLYGNFGQYVQQVSAQIRQQVNDGYLLPADAKELVREVKQSDIKDVLTGPGSHIPPDVQAQRDALTDLAEVYMFKGFLERDVEAVRAVLHPDAWRIENGVNTGTSGDDIAERFNNPVFQVITGIENLRWTVDLQRNEAFAIFDLTTTRLATPTRIFERFLIEDGLVKEIEAQFTIPPDSLPVCEVVEEIPC